MDSTGHKIGRKDGAVPTRDNTQGKIPGNDAVYRNDERGGKRGEKEIALVVGAMCKGEGACVPICPYDAIDIEGYRDDQITAMIDAGIKEAVL